jgi:hypothetical protein
MNYKYMSFEKLSHFSRFSLGFNDAIFSMVDNVSVNNKLPVMTLSISRFISPTQLFQGAHKDRTCGKCIFVYVRVYVYNWI